MELCAVHAFSFLQKGRNSMLCSCCLSLIAATFAEFAIVLHCLFYVKVIYIFV